MRVRVLLMIPVVLYLQGSGDELRPVGWFGNVRSDDGGEHCDGYSIGLWRHNGELIGLFNRHQGLCGDPPCEALRDVSYNSRTGRLTFSALDEKFAGMLRRDDVIGTIGNRRVRLSPSADVPTDGTADMSFAEWCAFWRGVHRCKGVDRVCAAASQ